MLTSGTVEATILARFRLAVDAELSIGSVRHVSGSQIMRGWLTGAGKVGKIFYGSDTGG